MTINGLDIPDELSDVIESGMWSKFAARPDLPKVFAKTDVVQPNFYNEASLIRENSNWPQESDPVYLGAKTPIAFPGDIDPAKSVLIGDLGPDRLIALDYRTSSDVPRVVYLVGEADATWVEVAGDIETLIEILSSEIT